MMLKSYPCDGIFSLHLTNIKDPYMSPLMRKLFMPYGNNKGAGQTAYPRSLISTFVVRYQDSTISLVSISELASLQLPSVAA